MERKQHNVEQDSTAWRAELARPKQRAENGKVKELSRSGVLGQRRPSILFKVVWSPRKSDTLISKHIKTFQRRGFFFLSSFRLPTPLSPINRQLPRCHLPL